VSAEPRVEPQFSPERLFRKLKNELTLFRQYGGRDNILIAPETYLCDSGRVYSDGNVLLVQYQASYFTLSLSAIQPVVLFVRSNQADKSGDARCSGLVKLYGARDYQSMLRQLCGCFDLAHKHGRSDMRLLFTHENFKHVG